MTNEFLKLNPNGTVTMCGRKTCCPTMEEIDSEHVKITDDEGNSIIIRKEQAKLCTDAVKMLDEKKLDLLCE